MKHLRVLGSVGEPIAAEVWKWYFETVGKEEAHVVDVSFFPVSFLFCVILFFFQLNVVLCCVVF
jgi:hypothetical protein